MSSTGNPTLSQQPESDLMQVLMTEGTNPKEDLENYLNG